MPPASTSKSSANRKGQSYAVQNRVKGNRAKSGCYTCRIRRKKCDERRIGETNSCGTCLRLNVECLGFGEKRPEWLRGPGVTQEIREKIKDHLGSQGMIKGHSGGGSKTQIQEKSLRLSEMRDVSLDAKDYPSGSSSSGSPGREYSVESEQLFMFDQLAAREYDYYGQTDMVPSGCESLTNPMIQFPYTEGLMVTAGCLDTPATRSRISTLYNAEFTIDPEPDYIFDAMNPPASIIFPSNILPDYLITDSVHTYVNNIIKIQYMLGDKVMLPEMIWEAVNQHIASKEAVSLLSQAYNQRKVDRNSFLLQDKTVQHRVLQLREMLILAETNFKADDAMAALHVVSLYLFDGGQGRWDEFLNFACSYTIKVLEDPCYGGNYIQALEGANDKDQFVIKTTIWFDVLASVTTMKPPRLLEHIRQLFHPTQAPRKYSMLSPMGCENSVVLALAETSNLAYYKAKSERQGCLSVRQLVNKVQEIEPLLLPGPLPMEPRDSPEGWSRYLTSEIFRTSTRLFLQSVESGDHPHVPEIQLCVHDTLAAILRRPPREACLDILTTSAVIRSTVFAFYICGSLADSEQILNILQAQLTQEISDEGIGNTMTISALLTRLWDERRTQMPGHPVRWRRLLRKAEILLV